MTGTLGAEFPWPANGGPAADKDGPSHIFPLLPGRRFRPGLGGYRRNGGHRRSAGQSRT